MKIAEIEINNYRQFEYIKFDFTYPFGHKREGEPLDKVCFIGQSGTGKTTLLNIISKYISSLQEIAHDDILHHATDDLLDHIRVSCLIKENPFIFDGTSSLVIDKHGNYSFEEIIDAINSIDKLCLFIKDSVALEADLFLFGNYTEKASNNLIRTNTQVIKDRYERENQLNSLSQKRIIELGEGIIPSIWNYFLQDIYAYDEKGREFAKKIISNPNNFSANKLLSDLASWKAKTPNPRKEIADLYLNRILDKFHLKIDVEDSEAPLVLKTTSGVKIDNSYLSTGTRQLLSTAIPLFAINTHNTVIIIDEPERSLFPDIQRELIKYYTSLAPDSQFFFATHSPIIAASFEPEERFILYFDENGNVQCRNGVAPIGDDPNDVLRQDFGMSPLMQDAGLKAYQRYVDLATAIKNEPDIDRKMNLLGERAELGNRYNFPALNETN
ncbi:AAA family ATPase [Fibrella sp. WM1]|uniref:AAA family ATPase n=1 Tax=Fibrella musci TaxID=3242485 RepID=UPI003522261B